MKKNNKRQEPKDQDRLGFKRLINDKRNMDFLFCLLIVLILFIPSLARPWLTYDERIIHDNLYFPAVKSIGELFEIINEFGLNFNIVSSNTIYSSNYITRNAPFGELLGLILTFLFQKSPIMFHAFSLLMHITNSFLFYLVLKTFLLLDIKPNTTITPFKRLVLIGLTSIWAIHPVNVESVMLASNFGALFSYMFFFGFLLDFLLNRERKISFLKAFLIPIIFLIPMLTNEYIVSLPLILLIISFYFNYKQNLFLSSLKNSFNETKPYIYGLIIFTIYFLLSNYKINHLGNTNEIVVSLQRIFWLAPQIFFHHLKLIFYPHTLSIDQTIFVTLGKTLTDPYAITCIIFFALWLLVPLTSFVFKKKLSNLFLLCWLFFLGALPFLHILGPSYTLVAERYLYIPLAMITLGLFKIFSDLTINEAQLKAKYVVSPVLAVILVLCFGRSFARTSDWGNDYTFINSTYKTTKDPLLKAMRLGMLAKVYSIANPQDQKTSNELFIKTLGLLESAKNEITKLKEKHQKNLPEVIKAYGLDYTSQLSKIAFLKASTECLELHKEPQVGLKILEPYTKTINKTDPRIIELYAHLLVQNEELDTAKQVLLKANEAFPNTNFILSKLIDILYKTKDIPELEKYLSHALRIFIHDNDILIKALNYYREEKKEPQIAKYSYLFGLRTGSKQAYLQSFASYLNTNDLRNAKKAMNKVLKLDAFDPEVLYFVSKYYFSINDHQKALEYMVQSYENTKFIETQPEVVFDVANNLAKLYLFLGMKEQALGLKDELLNLAGNNKDNLIKIARFYKEIKLQDYLDICLKKIKTLSNT